jgi:hypothetical protein
MKVSRLLSARFVTVLAAAFLLVQAGTAGAAEFDKYAVDSVSASLSTTQAGAHPDFTTAFELTSDEGEPFAFTRDVMFDLPPGMIGNPLALPRCTVQQFGTAPTLSECPQDSQVGVSEITLGGLINSTLTEPVYNLIGPGGDVVARLGFYAGPYPTIVNVRVDPSDYGLVATIEGAASAASLLAAKTTLWGVPAAGAHDSQRLTPVEASSESAPPGRKSGLPEVPFMTNPTSCSTQRQISVTATSYQLPGSPSSMTAPFQPISGCGKLSFDPKLSVTPTNPEAAAPTGIDAELQIPQDEAANSLATSTLKSAVVSLPQGFTINPAAGDGLASCSAAEVGFERNEDARCPDAAKIGSVELEVPALEHVLQGSVYQRTPEPGHLFRFWVVADELGAHLKLPAEIQLDPLSGQVTTLFLGIPSLGGNPQVPVADLKLHIFGGPRAPLSTPQRCGTYQTHYELAPWSGKPAAVGETAMQITGGCGKGGFAPKLRADTLASGAGRFSTFLMDLTRADGEENIAGLELTLPEGLLAKLAGVPLCADAAAATGACPVGSKIGSVAVAAGTGALPLWIPQPGKTPTAVYLSGPYKGAPYSFVVTVPAQAGPFDLGTVVTRAGLHVDPQSARATVKADPLPQILEGVPVAYRDIRVTVDRPEFTLNPTDCDAMAVEAHLTSSGGATATATSRFQATNCARLGYAPKLKLRFKGSTKRTGNPAVSAVLTQRPGEANTEAATVILPASEFIDQSHINNPCTRVQFNQGACPASSLLGTARAISPLLDQPLEGPVYFRSNGGERELPDIVADLKGPIHITLVGYVDSVHEKGSEVSRLRTRFANVPDAPVAKFTMNLFGGKRGLIENSRDICKTGRRAKIQFVAQSGRVRSSQPTIATSCAKRGKR